MPAALININTSSVFESMIGLRPKVRQYLSKIFAEFPCNEMVASFMQDVVSNDILD